MTSRAFGKYEVVRTLGAGGMGEVFVARDRALNRLVAIKAVHPHLAADPTFGARFEREARIIAQLDHPNIVPVYDFDGAHVPPFMVMPLISGQSLRERLAERRATRHRGLPFAEVERILSAVAAALDAAHAKSVIHRDVKPANVLLSEDGSVRLTDFGIAKLLDESAGEMQLSLPDSSIGTATYMSPEQAAGKPAVPRSDIYSLGVMLFEMVTGRPPFKGGAATAVMLSHVADPAPDACVANPQLTPSAGAAIGRALAKKPEDRPETARALAEAFAAGLAMSPESDEDDHEAMTVPETPVAAPVGSPSLTPVPAPRQAAPPPGGAPSTAPVHAPGQLAPPPVLADDLRPAPVSVTSGAARTRAPKRIVPAVIGLGAVVLALAGVGLATQGGAPMPGASPTATAFAPPPASPTALIVAQVATVPPPPPLATSTVAAPEPRYGEARVAITTTGAPGSVQIRLDNVTLPASGTRYVLWAGSGAEVQRLGVLTVENARIRQSVPLPKGALDGLAAARITYETDSSAPRPSSRVAFVASANTEISGALRALSAGAGAADPKKDIGNAEEQLAIAIEHQGLMQKAIQAGDLRDTRRHAEHVVNIIEGKSGPLFGDLDRSGVAENPGDDVGVKAHLASARAGAPESAQTAFGEVTAILQDAIGQAVKVLSVDKVADGAPFATQGAALLNSLSPTAGGESRLAAAAARLPAGVDVPLLRGPTYPQLPAVDTVVIPSPVLSALAALGRPATGVMAVAEGQYQIAAEHLLFLERSLAAGNLAESRQHGEHITNILEGARGKRFGDRNGNGRTENPGDGVGVLGHIERAVTAAGGAPASFYVLQFSANATRTLELVDAASASAARIAAADTVAEAQRLLPSLRIQLRAVLDGDDRDLDGVVEALFGEGGLRSIRSMAAAASSPR